MLAALLSNLGIAGNNFSQANLKLPPQKKNKKKAVMPWHGNWIIPFFSWVENSAALAHKYSNSLRRLNIDALWIATPPSKKKKRKKINWETLGWSVIVTLINDWGNSLPAWASA